MSVASRIAAFVGSRSRGGGRPTPFSFVVPSFSGPVYAVEWDEAGGAYFGGGFSSVTCGVTGITYSTGYANLVYCLPGGAVDASFSAAVNAAVRALRLSASGLYVAGSFGQISGVTRERLARLRPAGSALPAALDAWYPRPDNTVWGLDVDEVDGHCYAVGQFRNVGGGSSDFSLATRDYGARFGTGATATLSGWDPDADGTMYGVIVRRDHGFVYLYGAHTKLRGGFSTRPYLARATLDEAISIDPWRPEPTGIVYGAAFSPDGSSMYPVGAFLSIGGLARLRAAQVSTGATPTVLPWRPDFDDLVNRVLVTSSGAVLLAGRFGTVGGAAADFPAEVMPAVAIVSSTTPCALRSASYGFTDAVKPNVFDVSSTTDATKVAVVGDFDDVTAGAFSKAPNCAVLELPT